MAMGPLLGRVLGRVAKATGLKNLGEWLGRFLKRPPTPNANAARLLRDPAFQRSAMSGVECAETAGALAVAAGGRTGGTLSISAPGRVKHPTRLGIAESNHHQVFTDGKYVFDPLCSENPIPRAEYEGTIRQLNGPDVEIGFFAAQQ